MKSREDLTRMSRGYWESRMVLTAVELGVFEALGRRAFTAQTIAKRAGSEPRATELLLNALVGQGILTKKARSYSIAAPMVPLLTDGPESAMGMLRHHAVLWKTWDKLTDCVLSGKAAKQKESFRTSPEAARAFTMAMRDGARRFAPAVAAEVRLGGKRLLLDLGGGPGIYAAAFARLNPKLRVVVVDLPDVAKVGEELLAEHPDVRDRISYHPADLLTDPLPAGADAAFLSHVIHGDSEDRVVASFEKIAASLSPGGTLVVRDFFLEPDGTQPASASLFSLNMLVNTPGGRSYTGKEVAGWLKAAGFATAAYRRSKAAPDTGT